VREIESPVVHRIEATLLEARTDVLELRGSGNSIPDQRTSSGRRGDPLLGDAIRLTAAAALEDDAGEELHPRALADHRAAARALEISRTGRAPGGRGSGGSRQHAAERVARCGVEPDGSIDHDAPYDLSWLALQKASDTIVGWPLARGQPHDRGPRC
jgi:hypothetical protein